MSARFPQGKQPEFPMHCIGTRKLSDLIFLFVIDWIVIIPLVPRRTVIQVER